MATSRGTLSNKLNQANQTDFSRTQAESDSFVLPTSAGAAVLFDKSHFSAIAIHVDGAGGNTITFYGCTRTAFEAANGTPTAVALRDKAGAAITLDITLGAGIYNINPELFTVPMIAPVINSGTVNAVLIFTK